MRCLNKVKLYSMHCECFIENEADLLLAVLGCSPARTAVSQEDRFDGKVWIFGRHFDGSEVSEIQPLEARVGLAVVCSDLTILFRTFPFSPKSQHR